MNILNWLGNLFQAFFKQPAPVQPQNSGVILGNQPTDYFAGVNSPIPYLVRIPDGNWTPFAFDQRNQFCVCQGKVVDFMSCVTCSLLSTIEAQEFFLTGKQVKYSRRWLAKISGTTREGNYLYKVADAVRNIGLVLESSYPDIVGTWEDYYADIPPALNARLLQEAGLWKTKWDFAYEFLQVTDPNLDYHLKHSPIQVVIPGHAIAGIYSPDQLMQYLDSYAPYFKKAPVAGLQAAMKGILTAKGILAREIGWQGLPELGVYIPADSLQRLDFIKQNLPTWLPGYELDETVYRFPTKKPF